ncbi:hypothetical protein [Allobaculum sp. JKK-2023]|uniref:hypothetical protein n=1 Tax=Allobaculum sp. JKK-2023 TaxID=3108943 RepID=UPI002B0549B8|nr:hypothetical protein [Allobaculum sp. JKK-2023]
MNTNKTYTHRAIHQYAPKNTFHPTAHGKKDLPAVIRACLLGMAGITTIIIGVLLSMNAFENGSTFTLILGIMAGLIGLVSISFNSYLYKKEMI